MGGLGVWLVDIYGATISQRTPKGTKPVKHGASTALRKVPPEEAVPAEAYQELQEQHNTTHIITTLGPEHSMAMRRLHMHWGFQGAPAAAQGRVALFLYAEWEFL